MRHLSRRGYTLIELLLVVVIGSILLAIVIPNFYGASNATAEKAATLSLNIAYRDLTDQQNHSFAPLSVDTLVSQATLDEPQLTFVSALASTASGPPTYITVDLSTGTLILANVSSNGALCQKVGVAPAACSGSGYSTTYTGPVIIVSVPGAPVNNGPPLIADNGSGTLTVPRIGDTLSVSSSGRWLHNPSYSYNWYWDGSNSISGATDTSYTISAADYGHTLSVQVTASNSVGSTAAMSNATGLLILPLPVNTALPLVSGTATVGQTLTATSGSWTNTPSYSYQWQHLSGGNWSTASGSPNTAASYTTVLGDLGDPLRVSVTATNSYGAASMPSAATGAVLNTYANIVLADNPIAFWRLGESSGTTAVDASPNGLNATYVGSPTLGVAGALSNNSNTAISLNGPSQYLTSPNLTALAQSSPSVTAEVWFKANGPGVIMSENSAAAPQSTWNDGQIEVISNNVYIRVWNLAALNVGSIVYGDGRWHEIVLRYNAASTTLNGFLDGVKAAGSDVATRQTPWPTYQQFYNFGASNTQNMGSGAALSGSLDEIAIFNTPLTDAQITTEYAAHTN
jgi:prepilin-type N-terminal cleavage/methylation domain-containing protein